MLTSKISRFLLSISFSLLLLGCVPIIRDALPSQQSTLPTPTPKLTTVLIVDSKGKIELTRKEWNHNVRSQISQGAEYHLGDLLWVASDAQVTVICPDLSLQLVDRKGSYGLHQICPNAPEAESENAGQKLSLPRGQDIYTPYIIRPRATNLLNNMPLLKWTPAAGATTYTIHVMVNTKVLFSTTISQTETQYTGQPLVAENEYLLIVRSDANPSRIETEPNREFSLLPSQVIEQVNAITKEVKLLGLTKSSELLVITYIYKSFKLYAEAIDQIEAYPAINGRLALQMGEMYIQIGLPRMAEKWCELATSAAEVAYDQEMQAQALICLGQAQLSNGELDQAKESLIIDREIYTPTLGAQQDVERIDTLLP